MGRKRLNALGAISHHRCAHLPRLFSQILGLRPTLASSRWQRLRTQANRILLRVIMNGTLLPIRLIFISLCAAAGWLVCLTEPAWDDQRLVAVAIGLLLGTLLVLVDLLLKGFSLRGLSAISFGLLIGSFISYMISVSPLLGVGDPQVIFLVRLALFLGVTYLATVIALRGKDEFNLVIPYVRFVPHEVDVPLVVVDTSALIDGRLVRICASGFIPGALVVPSFVIKELQSIADSPDSARRARGRRGLDALNELRQIKPLDLRIHESEAKRGELDAKLVFIATSLRAKLLTLDENLARMAGFHSVVCLHPAQLSRALQPTYSVGEIVDLDLAKPGKDERQAVGYLHDGSMVVVNDAAPQIGQQVRVEILSVMPSGNGRLIFARLATRD